MLKGLVLTWLGLETKHIHLLHFFKISMDDLGGFFVIQLIASAEWWVSLDIW